MASHQGVRPEGPVAHAHVTQDKPTRLHPNKPGEQVDKVGPQGPAGVDQRSQLGGQCSVAADFRDIGATNWVCGTGGRDGSHGQPRKFGKPAAAVSNQILVTEHKEEEVLHRFIASPMCAAFSSLQHLNYWNMTPHELEPKLKAAKEHLDFALKMCEIQVKTCRTFVFEQPVHARSWSLSLVKRLFKYKNVTTVDFDSC